EAIGFKAVHGGPISGAVRVTDEVIRTMEQFADVAPAHNPPYIAAMRAFREKMPGTPQVAAFETAFHQTVPMRRQLYGIPKEWTVEGVWRRVGKGGGRRGRSGVSKDMREGEGGGGGGRGGGGLAVEAFVGGVRHYVGAFLGALGGCDVLAFTGGIGENGVAI